MHDTVLMEGFKQMQAECKCIWVSNTHTPTNIKLNIYVLGEYMLSTSESILANGPPK